VVGAQRSGTTMLRLMMNAHPELGIPFEADFLPAYEYARDSGYDAARVLGHLAQEPLIQKGGIIEDPQQVLDMQPQDFPELVAAAFSAWAANRGKTCWGIKTPGYVTHMDTINQLFPECRFIHIVRDGRDVATSYTNLSWGNSHIVRLAEDWQWKVTLGHKMGRMLGERYLEIRFEQLVLEPEEVLREICAFLALEFSPAMLSYHENATAEMPSDSMKWHQQSVSAPNRDKIGAWQRELSAADQVIFEQVAGEALEMLGYDKLHSRPTLSSRLKYLYLNTLRRW